MEKYCHLIQEINELNYRNNISREVSSRRKIIDAFSRLEKYRSTSTINTAIFAINYKNMLKKQRGGKIKTLKIPDAFVQSKTREVLKLLEKSVDAGIKKECSLCGPIRTPPSSSQATTTHGTDLPINFACAKRWIPSSRRHLIIEQTGRYEGPRFVPYSAGKYLHWVSNNSTLESKNCCLLDYLNRKALEENILDIENISLQLVVRNNDTVTHIDEENIKVAILL